MRPKPDVERFFDGLQLVEPGVRVAAGLAARQRRDAPTDAQVSVYGAIARKA